MTSLGIEIIDVRLRRADYPESTSQNIFNRMKSEREREAKEFRATGEEGKRLGQTRKKLEPLSLQRLREKRRKIGAVETARPSKYMQTALEKMQISFHFIGLWKPTVQQSENLKPRWCYLKIQNSLDFLKIKLGNNNQVFEIFWSDFKQI